MKFARRLPSNPTLEQQVKLLTKLVLITHDKFDKGTTGIIVSQTSFGYSNSVYWVLLDVPFKTKNGRWSRKKMFKPAQLKTVED